MYVHVLATDCVELPSEFTINLFLGHRRNGPTNIYKPSSTINKL